MSRKEALEYAAVARGYTPLELADELDSHADEIEPFSALWVLLYEVIARLERSNQKGKGKPKRS